MLSRLVLSRDARITRRPLAGLRSIACLGILSVCLSLGARAAAIDAEPSWNAPPLPALPVTASLATDSLKASLNTPVFNPASTGSAPSTGVAGFSGASAAPAPDKTGGEVSPLLAQNEYELYAERATGQRLKRFGADFFERNAHAVGSTVNAVPPDYQINVGDEIMLRTWGSVDSDLRLVVDREGYVNVPRVGRIAVSGARYGDLPNRFKAEIARYYASFDVSVSLGKLRGVTVYVTGFAVRPGAYVVNGLATLLDVLSDAGGPDASGSMRRIEVRRNGQVFASFDGYQLLLGGDRSKDTVLRAGDIVNVAALGQQVAIYGSVNSPGIFEMKAGETVGDLVRFAGGLNTVADGGRITLATLRDRASTGVRETALDASERQPVSGGDIYRLYSTADYAVPIARQARRVRIEGEVMRPGDYLVTGTTTLPQLIEMAGGTTSDAFLFGTELVRESVRRTQQTNFDRALQEMELAVRSRATVQASSRDDAADRQKDVEAGQRFIAKLREMRPTGRIVLDTGPNDGTLPPLTLEDGDRLAIPPRPTTVGVYGSVFNQGSYLFRSSANLGDYIALAGGARRTANTREEFVLRANGTTRSNQQGGWFSSIGSLDAMPGDTVFVPEDLERITWWQAVKEFSTILSQFGLSAAAIKVLLN
ncbi:polysaccharide biosynthesis protein [Caballeronia hypogeia]|uniref:Polysaccharide biosynthesis protein n=1 Tax=Caballeronia hypogeia TaxID=1777140 RepID=A0A158DES9_9BURK|nr:SLBB domain-containing protein [Caballeronia hypogeia]SAK92920.1 polysaccharide biosynthesis protein [Caballeronia hypogeia]